jgi:TolB-like protein
MPGKPKGLSHIWKEVKRRNVLRSLAIYAGSAFIILEAATIIFPRWGFPDWSIDLVLYLLILGVFINVIVAWFFDLTAQGMQKTKPLDDIQPHEKPSDSLRWKAATYISLVVIVALIVLNIVGGPKQLRAGDIQSLLILPFDNFTGDDQLDYVAAGMHSSLIGDMAQISSLRIISKTTARRYKDLEMSLPEIATILNADAVVEPIVMCYGDSVCIQIRVITPFPEEKQLWIGEYKEEKSQIMSLYNQVTKQIAEELKVQLTPGEELLLAETRTINSEAYDLYLKGLYYWDLFTPESLPLALEYFNKAIGKDSQWALPYAGVTYFWVAIHQFSLAPPSVSIPNMFENLNKAIELDPNSSFVHYVNALVNCWTSWNWEKAEGEFLKVLEMAPNDAFGHMYYAHLLTSLKRGDEALAHCRTSLNLDPLNPMIQGLSTMVLANAGNYKEAISMAEKVLAVIPGNQVALTNLIGIYAILGEYRKSLEIWTTFLQLEEDTRTSILNTFDEQGLDTALIEFISELEATTGSAIPMELAQLYTLAGDESMALYWYEKGYESHHPMMPYINTNFSMAGPFNLDHPGFDSIIMKMNLPLE